MARLTYTMLASLDGFVTDEAGNFDWAAPTDEVHAFVNDLERSVGTYLYGRRMYETMAAWQTLDSDPGTPPVIRDFAQLWRGANKVVFSRTLESVSTPRTTLVREFDPLAIRELKTHATRDLSIGGPDLAGQALRAGLVDELGVLVVPYLAGGGHPWLPRGLSLRLQLLDHRRFADGTAYLRYAVT